MAVFSKVIAVLAGLYTVASAAPAINFGAKFSVDQVSRQSVKVINIAATYAKAIAKFGGIVPPDLLAAAETGTVTTIPTLYDEEYVTQVTVGSGKLELDFDTGSADLWVFSRQLPSSQSTGHVLYTPSSSGTLLPGYNWSITYGDGSYANGDVYQDYVNVGGISTKQAVEAAIQVSSQFVQDTNNDGLLGLAFSTINTVTPAKQQTFFDNIKYQLANPLFAVTLKRGAPGTYDFGYIDTSKYTGSIAYTSVDNSQGFWSFTANGYRVGSGSAVSTSIYGIADTGTTLLLLPSDIVAAYYQGVSGARNDNSVGGYIFPCSSKLPDFTVVINGYNAVIPGNYMNYAPITKGSSTCFGGIQSDAGIGFSIFGDIFLKDQYVVFDSTEPRLGFAPQA